MMKGLLLICCCLVLNAEAQRYQTSSASVQFFSEAPLEDISAITTNVNSVMDTASKAIVILIPIKSFEFEKKLMQEHFNENYLESEKYPNAIFKGKIDGLKTVIGTGAAKAIGTLELHGVVKEVKIDGNISFDGNTYKLVSTFNIRLEDYKIKIPKAVFYNIAEEVEVSVDIEYVPYEKN